MELLTDILGMVITGAFVAFAVYAAACFGVVVAFVLWLALNGRY